MPNTEIIRITRDNAAELLVPGEHVTIHYGTNGQTVSGPVHVSVPNNDADDIYVGVPGWQTRLSRPGTWHAGKFSLQVEVAETA